MRAIVGIVCRRVAERVGRDEAMMHGGAARGVAARRLWTLQSWCTDGNVRLVELWAPTEGGRAPGVSDRDVSACLCSWIGFVDQATKVEERHWQWGT